MSLLDDARRLAEKEPVRGIDCLYCAAVMVDEYPHEPDCPWLSLPKIVAALEALELSVLSGERRFRDATVESTRHGRPEHRNIL